MTLKFESMNGKQHRKAKDHLISTTALRNMEIKAMFEGMSLADPEMRADEKMERLSKVFSLSHSTIHNILFSTPSIINNT